MLKQTAKTSPTQSTDQPVIASVNHVSKIYGKEEARVFALNDVSLEFKVGEFVAIMGPSGSGKSTLLHCASALDRVTSGQVNIAGHDITYLNDKALTKLRRTHIGFIFQAYNLIPILTALENITLPLQITNLKRTNSQTQTFFKELIHVLGLKDRLSHLPSELSGGQQQRVAVARALITRPALVFADEPTGNLDSRSSNELMEFLKRANVNYQQTIVMVTHSAHIASYSQRVIFLKDGQIVDHLQKPTVTQITQKINSLES